jgi:hypothetical protein
MQKAICFLIIISLGIQGGNNVDARVKKLTDAVYSPTIAASEETIRTQVDGSIQEVYDIVDEAKLDKTGDHLGTWQGLEPTQAEPGLTAVVNNMSKNINLNKASMGSVPYGEIALMNYVADFPDVGFNIWRDSKGVIQHNFNVDQFTAGATAVYAASSVGSEGTGTSISPYRTLTNAIAQCMAGGDSKYVIYCKDMRFDRGFSVQNAAINGKTIAIMPDPVANTSGKIILSNHQKSLVWSADGTGTWKATRSSVLSVYDLRVVDAYNMPIPLENISSLASCQATVNSWYTDETYVWIHTSDGLVPNDTNFIVNVANSTFEPVITNGGKLYIENCTILYGRSTPDNRPTGDSTGATDSEFYANNCKFSGGYLRSNIYVDAGNALSILDIRKTYLINCITAYGGEDGFNYHYTAPNQGNCFAVEIDCISYKNGVYSTTNTSNSTTCHDSGYILRIRSIGYDAKGPVLADVSGAKSIILDCHMRDSLRPAAIQKAAYYFGDGDGKAVCINSDGGGIDTYSYSKTEGLDLTLQACRGVNFPDGFSATIIP